MKADRAAVLAAAARLAPATRLILLAGPDESASRDLADRFAKTFDDSGNPLAVETLTAAEIDRDPQALVAAAANISMFGDRTLVRVDGAGEDTLAAVAALLDAPPGGNPVVIVAGILRKGSKLLARVEGDPHALALVSYAPDGRSAAAAVDEIARDFGVVPGRGAGRALFEACGGDRAVLRRELEKLALYVDGTPDAPKPFDLDDLAAIGADVGDAETNVLVASITGGDAATADRQMTRLSAQGLPAITLIRAVQRRLWLLLDLRQAIDGGASASSAVDSARPPVFWKDKAALTSEASRWRTPMVRAALARLLAVERAIKRSGSAGEVLATQAMLALAAQASGRTG